MLAKDPNASTDPSAPPVKERRRLSVNNCRTRRPRPAPMDSRSAISLWRTEARASRRLATFAQAINSTSPKAPKITEATGIRSSRSSALLKNVPMLRASEVRSEEHTSELQSHSDLVCRLLLEKKNQD